MKRYIHLDISCLVYNVPLPNRPRHRRPKPSHIHARHQKPRGFHPKHCTTSRQKEHGIREKGNSLCINPCQFRANFCSSPSRLFLPLLVPPSLTSLLIHSYTLFIFAIFNEVVHIFVVILSATIIPNLAYIRDLTEVFFVVEIVFRRVYDCPSCRRRSGR